MLFPKDEVWELFKSWAIVTLVFTIAYASDAFDGPPIDVAAYVLFVFIASGIGAGSGFLLHEIAHKMVAQHYGLEAQYKGNDSVPIISIFVAFAGWILLAPGAVHIRGRTIGRNASAYISAAGPATNIALAAAFLPALAVTSGLVQDIAWFGFKINSWLALFNLLPVPGFDGQKLLASDKVLYLSLAAAAVYLVYFL